MKKLKNHVKRMKFEKLTSPKISIKRYFRNSNQLKYHLWIYVGVYKNLRVNRFGL